MSQLFQVLHQFQQPKRNMEKKHFLYICQGKNCLLVRNRCVNDIGKVDIDDLESHEMTWIDVLSREILSRIHKL